jgi:hypothetical protein
VLAETLQPVKSAQSGSARKCEPTTCAPLASLRPRLRSCLGFNGASSRWAVAALPPQR